MERRYGPREPVSLDVEIYRGQCKLGQFKSRDIGFEGMFVATKRLGLSVGELVTIRLSLELSDIEGYLSSCRYCSPVKRWCGAHVYRRRPHILSGA